jgi:hypothetical protein
VAFFDLTEEKPTFEIFEKPLNNFQGKSMKNFCCFFGDLSPLFAP